MRILPLGLIILTLTTFSTPLYARGGNPNEVEARIKVTETLQQLIQNTLREKTGNADSSTAKQVLSFIEESVLADDWLLQYETMDTYLDLWRRSITPETSEIEKHAFDVFKKIDSHGHELAVLRQEIKDAHYPASSSENTITRRTAYRIYKTIYGNWIWRWQFRLRKNPIGNGAKILWTAVFLEQEVLPNPAFQNNPLEFVSHWRNNLDHSSPLSIFVLEFLESLGQKNLESLVTVAQEAHLSPPAQYTLPWFSP